MVSFSSVFSVILSGLSLVSSSPFSKPYVILNVAPPYDAYSGVYRRPSDHGMGSIKTCGLNAFDNYDYCAGGCYLGTYFYKKDGENVWIYLDGQAFDSKGNAATIEKLVNNGIFPFYHRLIVTENDPNLNYDKKSCNQYGTDQYVLAGPYLLFSRKNWAQTPLSGTNWQDKNGVVVSVSICAQGTRGCKTAEPTTSPTGQPTDRMSALQHSLSDTQGQIAAIMQKLEDIDQKLPKLNDGSSNANAADADSVVPMYGIHYDIVDATASTKNVMVYALVIFSIGTLFICLSCVYWRKQKETERNVLIYDDEK